MDQLFPTPVDDPGGEIDIAAMYASDDRRTSMDRPWVMANMISSIDGGIAIDGVSGGLGGPADREVFSAIRSVADVIIAASGTVIAENYRQPQTPPAVQQTRVERGQARVPRIAIVSASLRIDADHRVFEGNPRPLIITHHNAHADRVEGLSEVADIIIAGQTHVDLTNALQQLGKLGARTVLLEGGPTLNGAFILEDLIDEFCLCCSPLLVAGSASRLAVSNRNPTPLPMRLDRTLHQDGFLFHRYVRER